MGSLFSLVTMLRFVLVVALVLSVLSVSEARRGGGRGGRGGGRGGGRNKQCADGSEPSCADGSAPVFDGDRSTPPCPDGGKPRTCLMGAHPSGSVEAEEEEGAGEGARSAVTGPLRHMTETGALRPAVTAVGQSVPRTSARRREQTRRLNVWSNSKLSCDRF